MSDLSITYQNKIRELKDRLRSNERHALKSNIRTTTKTWKIMLIRNEDTVVVEGRVRQIIAKSIGAGVYELKLAPTKEEIKAEAGHQTKLYRKDGGR